MHQTIHSCRTEDFSSSSRIQLVTTAVSDEPSTLYFLMCLRGWGVTAYLPLLTTSRYRQQPESYRFFALLYDAVKKLHRMARRPQQEVIIGDANSVYRGMYGPPEVAKRVQISLE